MRIAVVFDTPNDGWEDEDFKREVAAEVDEAEYEVAEALMEYGHDVLLVGVHDDLHHMFVRLAGFRPELVFNCAEAFHERPRLDYILPALLEAEGYHYTGSPPTSLQITRNKAMSKKLLAYHGVPVPRFVTFRRTEKVSAAPEIPFPLIVKPLQEDASAGIAQASIVQDLETLAERVHFIHESFSQPAIAEEFIDGRELYVSVLGNGDRLEVLPIIEMVFDKRKNRPEERIAHQERVRAAHLPGGAEPDRGRVSHGVPGPMAAGLRTGRRAAHAGRPTLRSGGQRQPLHQLRTRHRERGGEGRIRLLRVHRPHRAGGPLPI
jgi:hypothetical protein